MKSITVLPLKGCQRSKKFIEYLETNQIPFQRIEMESAEGEQMMAKHHFLASPGILVDGFSVNPYDLLIQSECRINELAAKRILDLDQP